MRQIDRAALAVRDLLDRPGRSLLVLLVAAFACGFLFLVFSFHHSFGVLVVDRMLKTFPAGRVEVRERPVVRQGFVFPNAAAPLTVERSRGLLKLPWVKKVYYEELLRVPSIAVLDLGLEQIAFESPVYGISEDCIQPELPSPDTFAWRADSQTVPAVVNEDLLEVFNAAYAGARGLPRMAPETIGRVPLSLTVGRGVYSANDYDHPVTVAIRLVGTSRRAQTVGLNLPLGYVVAWNERYLGAAYRHSLTRLLIDARSPEGAELVADEAERQGYLVRTGRDAVRRLIVIQNAILAAGSFLGGAVLALACVAVGSLMLLSVSEQRPWIGLLRAVGMRRSEVYAVILLETLLLTGCSGAVGLGAALGLGSALDRSMLGRLPRFAFLPETFFVWDARIAGLCWIGLVVFCALAALPAARRAVGLSPIEALSA